MKLLITGAWNGAGACLDKIRRLGYEVLWMPDEKGPLPQGYREAEGVICNGLFLYHDLELFPALRFILLTSAGLDRVPLERIQRRGITICNARGVYSIPMAEFALCGVLQLLKQSRFFSRNQDNRCWKKHRGLLELYGRTVCIIGIGSVAQACAVRFSAFGCRVLGVNIRPRPVEHFDQVYGFGELDDVLQQTDVVVLAVPLTEQTRCLMNKERFQTMKSGSILVNLARGAVVDSVALLDALDTHLGGAVLDVFEQEPLEADSPLWEKENVLITPHNSFVGDGNQTRLSDFIMDHLACFSEMRDD